jgi:hypothetical protein
MRHHFRCLFEVLLRFDERHCVSKPFVLDDYGVTDTLVAENAGGKRSSFPSDLQTPGREVIKINVRIGTHPQTNTPEGVSPALSRNEV